jgi:signal transduction histidine kinase
MSWALAGLAALVGLALGWVLASRREAPDPHASLLEAVAAALAAGRRPDAIPGETAEVRRVREALAAHWTPRNEERERALQEALGRIAAYLRENLQAPLRGALAGEGKGTLREAAQRALGSLEDLEFFLEDPLTPDQVHNLVPVVQQVTREFTTDWEIGVRMLADDRPVRAHIHKDSFLDALYLLLHNAGQFGDGKTIDVTVGREGDRAKVVIRDHGPGFSAEALEHAHDLFYTTAPTSLGLGIPFARKIVESFGGDIRLRNPEGGGAEVELSLPAV